MATIAEEPDSDGDQEAHSQMDEAGYYRPVPGNPLPHPPPPTVVAQGSRLARIFPPRQRPLVYRPGQHPDLTEEPFRTVKRAFENLFVTRDGWLRELGQHDFDAPHTIRCKFLWEEFCELADERNALFPQNPLLDPLPPCYTNFVTQTDGTTHAGRG